MSQLSVPPVVSVVLPVFDQAAFLVRAIGSLLAQDGWGCGPGPRRWELVVVDDGSTDAPADAVRDLVPENAVRWIVHPRNAGLGAACNAALDAAAGAVVAYLPADDCWFPDHLSALTAALAAVPDGVLATTGVLVDGVEHPDATAAGPQLVQLAHRRTGVRWRERAEVESDDLELLLLAELRAAGPAAATGRVTCEWVQHPGQRWRTFARHTDGGLNPFRARYGATGPLRFAARGADVVEERELYGLPDADADATTDRAATDRHVLLVGELAYNADRILVLAARGIRFSGLWIDDPLGFMTVGPLPFGAVRDVPRTGWADALRSDPPDVAYCLLNWRSLAWALRVAEVFPDLPLVWHFKEAPQRCLARGDWPLLARLWEVADHVVLASAEEREWLELALPDRRDPVRTSVIDGDLPRARWFDGDPAQRPGRSGVHTVCVGRPVGVDAAFVATLAAADVHVHLHGVPGASPRTRPEPWLRDALDAAPDHLHVHPAVPPARWRAELSRYDAGWLHVSGAVANGGDLRRASWDDLNLPARLPTLAAAGLPVLLPDRTGSRTAVNRVVDDIGAGLSFEDADHAGSLLHDADRVGAARAGMAAGRERFTFEAVVDELDGILLTAAGR
ncbi:glycosyltransferase [Nakamurella deserti]|uniref:glycosyltransferase n=1 Tax=Nakamurella deserti TaxID=2164074 RepID=UPI00197C8210|nr:glycosyltransferase [Nakamurella deserti]